MSRELQAKPRAGQFDVQYQSGSGYLILDDKGRKVGGYYSSRDAAEFRRDNLQKDADAKTRRIVRPCLCCAAAFHSDGPHNRLCDRCRRQPEGAI